MLTQAMDGANYGHAIKQSGARLQAQADRERLAGAIPMIPFYALTPTNRAVCGLPAWFGRPPTEVPDNSPSEAPNKAPSEVPPSDEPENPIAPPPEYEPDPTPEVPIDEPPSDLMA